MKSDYSDLNLIRLSSEKRAVSLEKQLILIDNFNETSKQENTENIFIDHPVKLSFTVIIFCLAGKIKFQINLEEFELHANDVLTIQEGTIGKYLGTSEDTKVAVIAVGIEYSRIVNRIDAATLLKRLLYTSPLCHLDPEAMKEAIVVYRLMKAKIIETDNPFRKGALLGYMQALTYNAYKYLLAPRTSEFSQKKEVSHHEELYTRFMKEVRNNYMKERSISWYADVMCITPKYLSQVIHKASGRFAGDWIADYVILEAKALLKSRKYTIRQIADMLHFVTPSFFGKYFKDKVGCSPTEYQQQL